MPSVNHLNSQIKKVRAKVEKTCAKCRIWHHDQSIRKTSLLLKKIAKYKWKDNKKYLKYLKKEYFLQRKAHPKFAVAKGEFIQYQYFLMNPTKDYCLDDIIKNDRKRYEIEKKWGSRLAEYYNSYIHTPSKTTVPRYIVYISKYTTPCRSCKLDTVLRTTSSPNRAPIWKRLFF